MPEPAKESKLQIILDDLDFSWSEAQMDEAVELWAACMPFDEMVDRLRPPTLTGEYSYRSYDARADEVALLIMHLARQGRIGPRKDGVLRHD